jgi:hypothetical protein
MRVTVPPGSTTAIGSLPFATAGEAVEFVFSSGVDIPFWPQLPKRDFREWMVPQYGADLPGLRIDADTRKFSVVRGDDFIEALTAFYEKAIDPDAEFPLRREHASGCHAFLERSASISPPARLLKGHVTGPLTFVMGLNLEDGRPIYADHELRQAATMLLARNAQWQAREISRVAADGVLVFIDEPIYSALGTAAYLSVKAEDVRDTVAAVSAAIRAEGALTGLHCCGNADWDAVLSCDIDVLSFDAWNYSSTLAVYARAVDAFLERGGYVAWGIVPTGDEIGGADEASVAGKLDAAFAEFGSRGVNRTRLKERSLVTPSCGCGSLTRADTEKVFALLASAGRHLKSRI